MKTQMDLFDDVQEQVLGRSTYAEIMAGGFPVYRSALVNEVPIKFNEMEEVKGPCMVVDLLTKYMADRANEEFVIVHLNTACLATWLQRASSGGLSSATVEPREVFRGAVLNNSDSIVVAHNHPSGNPEPSSSDIEITRRLVEAGKMMGIPVRDHIIIAGDTFTSLAERDLME